MKQLTLKTLIATLAATVLFMAAPARAQELPYPGGVRLLTRDFDPANPGKSLIKPVFGDPKLMRQVVNTAWQAARASIADQIIAQMGQANSVGDGITPYNIVCNMGQPGDLSVTPGSYANGSTLQMKYLVHGNWIEFDTTQPTALGKWADPRFSCTYDLTLTMALKFGDAPGPLTMTGVTAQVSNSKIDSHGLIADLVFVGNDVAKLFGSDYIKKAQNAVNGKNFDFTKKLNEGLAPFNDLISGYGSLANSLLNAPEGVLPGGLSPRSLPGATPQGPQLLLFLNNDGKIPTRGTGEILGAIKWKKAWGEPTARVIAPGAIGLGRVSFRHPFARGFKIRAIAQSGFGHDGMFTPPMTEVGVLGKVTLDQAASDAGDSYVLRYVIEQLPLGIPIKVEAGLSNVSWQGEVGNQQRILGPTGWTGVITLKPGRKFDLASQSVKSSGIGGALRARSAAGSGGMAAPGAETGIIIVSGKDGATTPSSPLRTRTRILIPRQAGVSPGEAVALNPQPLPPKSFPGNSVMRNRVQPGGLRASRSNEFSTRLILPGGLDASAPATAAPADSISATNPNIFALVKQPIDNPTGTLSVAGIDFEMGLLTGPR